MSLLGGTSAPTTGSLQIRKTADGILVEGQAPGYHEFPEKFIKRELGDAIRITLEIQSDPPVRYEITRYAGVTEEDQEASHDLAGNLLPSDDKPRRKWWQRKK